MNYGRFVLPIELRQQLNIKEKDKLKVYTKDNKIILEKV